MVRVVGIHHLALVTGSLDRTLRFCRDLVGLQVRFRLGAPGCRQYILAAGGQTLLSLFEWSAAEPVPEKEHGVPVERVFQRAQEMTVASARDRCYDQRFRDG